MHQNKNIVISISPSGGVSALHMDEFPLSFLGRMEVNRASTIDFNQETQRFDINLKDATKYEHKNALPHWFVVRYLPDGRKNCTPYPASACGFEGYDEARAYEVAWIQQCVLIGVDPLDRAGIEVIDSLRKSGSPYL